MTEEECRDLIERAHQIETLTRYPEWEVFRDYLLARRQVDNRDILSGLDDHDRYLKLAGRVAGIDMALGVVDTTAEMALRARQMLAEATE